MNLKHAKFPCNGGIFGLSIKLKDLLTYFTLSSFVNNVYGCTDVITNQEIADKMNASNSFVQKSLSRLISDRYITEINTSDRKCYLLNHYSSSSTILPTSILKAELSLEEKAMLILLGSYRNQDLTVGFDFYDITELLQISNAKEKKLILSLCDKELIDFNYTEPISDDDDGEFIGFNLTEKLEWVNLDSRNQSSVLFEFLEQTILLTA